MRNYIWLILSAAVFLTSILFGIADNSHAMPASPHYRDMQQPDGTTIKVRQWGDEHSHGWETEGGHTVVHDRELKGWTYAVHDAEGKLTSSALLAKPSGVPPESVVQHLRPLKAPAASASKAVARDISTPKAPASGTKKLPVIMVQFSDKKFVKSRNQFNDLLFGASGTTMRNYFLENSYNKLTVTGGTTGVYGPVTANHIHDYYGANDSSSLDMYPGTLVYEAVSKAAVGGYKFAPFVDQTKGCYVDVVVIAHQGTGEESGYNDNDIWSHSWDLNDANTYESYKSGKGEFVTTEPCTYPGGGGHIKVNNYVIQPELAEPAPTNTMIGVGVYAHEFGHALGLPDLYDTDASASFGAGDWTLMASGSWSGPTGNGEVPSHLDAWSKQFLGWIKPIVVTGAYSFQTINAASSANATFYQLGSGTSKSGEYFLVENRQKSGFDSYLPGKGLLVWHIDEKYILSHLSSNTVNDTECLSKTPGACATKHYGVALLQADNLLQMEQGINGGSPKDPFYFSNNTLLTDLTLPNSKWWSGSNSGININYISAPSAAMTAMFTVPDTIPIITAFSIPAKYTSATVPIKTFSAVDDTRVAAYCLRATDTPASCVWKTLKPVNYTFTGLSAGVPAFKSLYAYVKDNSGNVSSGRIATTTITLPVVASVAAKVGVASPAASGAAHTTPLLIISSLANGAITNKETLNISGRVSDPGGIKRLTINSVGIAVANDGSFNHAVTLAGGANTLSTTLTDSSGNRSGDARTVILDKKAPTITVTGPADNSATSSGILTIKGSVGENNTVTATLNNFTTYNAQMNGTAFELSCNLAKGINTIAVTTRDLDGNTTTVKRTLTYDPDRPTVSIIDPAADTSVSEDVCHIRGFVTDAISDVSATITVDGATSSLALADGGSFEHVVTLTRAKQHPIIITVTDQAGNKTTVQRNIIY